MKTFSHRIHFFFSFTGDDEEEDASTATTTQQQQQSDDGETHSETAQSDGGSPTPTGTPNQSPSSSPAISPTPSSINDLNDRKSPINDLPKLRLNTILASDPALQPLAKTIRDIRNSGDNNLSVKQESNDFNTNIDDDDDSKDIKPIIVERSETIIVNSNRTPPIDVTTSRIRVFMCAPCNIPFSSLSTLEAHQTYYCSHRKDADENNSSTKTSNATDSATSEPPAKSIRTGKQYGCTQCSYSADKKVSLNRHMRMHQTSPTPSSTTSNGDEPPSQLQQQQQQIDRYCTDCDIRFSSTKTYRAHKQHYCSSRHRDGQSNTTTPKPPSVKGGSQSPPEPPKTPPVATAAPPQPYLALPTNPIVIVPYSLIRGASVLPGPL